jgi:hypothetical protein
MTRSTKSTHSLTQVTETLSVIEALQQLLKNGHLDPARSACLSALEEQVIRMRTGASLKKNDLLTMSTDHPETSQHLLEMEARLLAQQAACAIDPPVNLALKAHILKRLKDSH